MATQSDIASQIIAALAVSDPDLDTTIGTTTRKIVDAVAESIAEAYIDQHMLSYQYDVNSKIGADLDTFTQLFGIARLAAKRATGTVVFSRPAGTLTTPVTIPVNTQVGTLDQVPVMAVTVTPATIQIGQRSVLVPVQAASGGPGGNVAAGALASILTPLQGVTQVTNIDALTGGTNQETDDALRVRWVKTVFRSLAGTAAMYLGIALDDPDCYAASVVGASSTHIEQVQVVSGQATSDIDPDSVKFIYPRTAVVTATGSPETTTTADYNASADTVINVLDTTGFTPAGKVLVNGVEASYSGTTSNTFTGVSSDATAILTTGATVDQSIANDDVLLRDYDYTFDTDTTPPKIVTTGTGSRLVDSEVYTLSYEYVSSASRNIPTSSINNRVDVWCAGTRATEAQQSVVFFSTRTFNLGAGGDAGSPYSWDLYERPDGSQPFVGNVFIPLAFGPIITLPETISVDGTNYTLSTGVTGSVVHGTRQLSSDFQIVHRKDCFGYTSTSLFGIEWNLNHLPSDGDVFTISDGYSYNNVPSNVQKLISGWRLVGTDAKAHQARQVFLRFNLAVMYSFGASQSQTNTQIGTNLSKFLQSLSFGTVVQVSDVLNVISSTAGVDNVRFLNGADYPGVYNPSAPNATSVAIQQVIGGSVVNTFCDAVTGRPLDIVLSDDSVPVFDSISGGGAVGVPSVRAQNTFGIN